LISIKNFALNYGINPKALDNRVRKAKLQSVGMGLTADGKKTRLFPIAELQKLAEVKYVQHKNYYRVSVYDEYNRCYWVKGAGLTKKNAEQLLRDYLCHGVIAKMFSCGVVKNGNKNE
jgi:hypothetical protein